jgi:hypothetical protein
MSFLKKAIGGFESVVRDVSGNKDYHFGDLTKKALGVPTHSDEEKHTAVNDWIVLKDVASGRTYYQNNRLGVTQWDPPVPLQCQQPQQAPEHQQHAHDLPAGWQTLHDASGRPYYVNHATRLTTYERPVPTASGSCFSAQPPPQYAAFTRASSSDPSRVLVGAIKVNEALDMTEEELRAHIGEIRPPKKLFGSQKIADGWVEMRDEHGRVFFHNKVTNEVSYVRPSDTLGSLLTPTTDTLKGLVCGVIESVFDPFN